jgi:hypothetical protein
MNVFKKLLVFSFVCGLISGCSNTKKIDNPSNKFFPGKKLAKLENKKLKEASGLAASVNNKGHLWVLNDSGNKSEIYLVDTSLNLKLTCSLPARNRDWEDMAIGPGPDSTKTYIYVGDIGDNGGWHKFKYIYRFEEPKFVEGTNKVVIESFDKITFALEDEKKDTETLMIDPLSKDLYVVSKREEPVYLYRIAYPYPTTDTLTAKKLTSLPLTLISGGSISPDGKEVLLKNYDHIYYWNNNANLTLPDLLKNKPEEVPYEVEPQGEALAWSQDRKGFYSLSEKTLTSEVYLYFYEKK